jgi:very-short-patch-repair endonuclease
MEHYLLKSIQTYFRVMNSIKQHQLMLSTRVPRAISTAKMLRKRQTKSEILLWNTLRNRRPGDFKFRRQSPIDRYIVDCVCIEKTHCGD